MTRTLTAVTLLTLVAGGCHAPAAPPAGINPAAAAPAPEGQAGVPAAGRPAPVGTTNAASAPSAAAHAPRAKTIEVTVPEGTPLSIELLTPLSTKTATIETPISGRLRRAVEVNDRVVIPAGSKMAGVVSASERPGRVKGRQFSCAAPPSSARPGKPTSR